MHLLKDENGNVIPHGDGPAHKHEHDHDQKKENCERTEGKGRHAGAAGETAGDT